MATTSLWHIKGCLKDLVDYVENPEKTASKTPQLAHEIGVKLAKEMWGDRFEVIVTTHLDKEHLHCHFCFNSVSFRDGGKYNYSKAEHISAIRPKCRRSFRTGFSRSTRPVISTSYTCTTAICWDTYRSIPATSPPVHI